MRKIICQKPKIVHQRFFGYLVFLLVLLNLPVVLAHSDEFGEVDSMHFMHMGTLKFPIWSYYVEIIEHLVMFVVVAIALYSIYSAFSKFHIEKKEILGFFVKGFLFIGIGELLTLLHHFLFYPLGIFNAVFNHGLLLVGIAFLAVGLVKLIKYEENKRKK